METIDFVFGKRTYTVGEAGLIFVYETGLDLARVYVIALSEKCGTVIFYIPDDLFELISDRAEDLHCPIGKYIADLVEYQYALKKALTATATAGVAADEAAASIKELANVVERTTHSAAAAKEALAYFNKVLDECHKSREPERKANNWLKMHGLPMRRKGKGRKHHE